jgi:hypothetical protein
VYIGERIICREENICVEVIRLVAGWTFSILREERERERRKDNGLVDKIVT